VSDATAWLLFAIGCACIAIGVAVGWSPLVFAGGGIGVAMIAVSVSDLRRLHRGG
jgi:hypothetical protein